jgi:hypothetical protein
MYEITEPTKADLAKRFTYHAPKGDQAVRYQDIRTIFKLAAADVVQRTPQSREQSLALTKLEEAMFWANAAIARNE